MNSKEQLKAKLRAKLEAKQRLRCGKKQMENRIKLNSSNLDSDEDLKNCVASLLESVTIIKRNKGDLSIPALDKILSKNYKSLKEKYFPLYRAALCQEINIQILDMMLRHRQMIKNGEDEKEVSLKVGKIFAEKLNVDLDALQKSALENKQKMDNKK